MKVSVSILSNSIKPVDIVKKLDNTKADYIHIDIMDGKFVENKTWTVSEIKKITSCSKLPLDVHLMVENPSKYNAYCFGSSRVGNIDLKKILSQTKYGSDGLGGIITKGTMYIGYPR